MALTHRQRLLYRDTCTIYKMTSLTTEGSIVAKTPRYAALTTNVPCHLFSTPEVDEPQAPGRSKVVNIYTLDQFHFEVSVDIADTYVIQLTTPGHPLKGQFWMVEGNTRLIVSQGKRNANIAQLYAKRIPIPELAA